jgi:hypothetical protein
MRTWGSVFFFNFTFIIASAQNFSGGFNFHLPPFDTTTQFFLPEFTGDPIDNTSFVEPDDKGNFILNGKRLKLIGFNMAYQSVPVKEDADKIVGRMRKMGVNVVRLQFDQNFPRGIFHNQPGTRTFNPDVLDQLDYFIYKLKNNGIYVDLILMVSRIYTKSDGFPDGDSTWQENKIFSMFDPWVIYLQKEYAGHLLKHINPYTGRAMSDDPVLLSLEIINESNLIRYWWEGDLVPFSEGGRLTWRLSKELDSLWNKFLIRKYGTNAALNNRWSAGTTHPGLEMILNGGFEDRDISANWNLLLVGDMKAKFEKDTLTSHTGNASVKLVDTYHDGISWHFMFYQQNFTFHKDSMYTVEFWAKADKKMTFNIGINRVGTPIQYGGITFNATTSWQKYRFSAKVNEENEGMGCIIWGPNETGTIWMDDISLKESRLTGLESWEDLSLYSVKRHTYDLRLNYSDNRNCDYIEFYTTTMGDYFNEMKNYLKNDLGVKAMVCGSNYMTGVVDLISMKDMDFIDNHAYWDTPLMTNWYNWSRTDWTIWNTSMLRFDSTNTFNTLYNGFQVKGKPFTTTEYNHPFPNIYQTEGIPLVTAYSSFHGTDMLMYYSYNGQDYEAHWEEDYVPMWGFGMDRNNAMMVQFPVFAYAFRNNLIRESSNAIEIRYSKRDLYMIPVRKPYPSSDPASFYSQKYCLTEKVITSSISEGQTTKVAELPPEPVNPYTSNTGELRWDTNGIFTIETDRLINFTGFLNQFPNKALPGATLERADKFGTVTWLALEDTILKHSRKSLITISTRQQNSGMVWDGIHTVHDNYGSAPTRIDPMNLTAQLDIEADSIRVYPLNVFGTYDEKKFVAYLPSSPGQFRINLNQHVYKTCWFGVLTFLNGEFLPGVAVMNEQPEGLSGNYPNPFSDHTLIRFTLAANRKVELRIVDMKGIEVYRYSFINEFPGEHEIEINAVYLNSGIYSYSLETEAGIYRSKMMVIK